MIRNDKKDKGYVWVEYTDIFVGLGYASMHDDKEMMSLLNDAFLDMESEDKTIKKNSFRRMKKNSKVVKYLKEEVKIEVYENFIDQEVLKEALVRAYFEFNHQMKNKLSTYFRKYTENEINGIDNSYLKEEIKNDKILLAYIKEYDNFADYTEKKVNDHMIIQEKMDYSKKPKVISTKH